MKPPAFQFYADDFIGGTTTMTTTEVGAYIMLLCHQWSAGEIPNDERRLFAITRTNNEAPNEAAVRYVVAEKFSVCEDGKLRNLRMESVRAINKEFKKKSSDGGKASAAKRCGDSEWGKRMAAQRSGNEANNEPSNEANNEAATNSPSPSPSPIIITASDSPTLEKKVRKEKKPTDPRFQSFVASFAETYEDLTGSKYAMTGGRDGKQLQMLLKSLPDLDVQTWEEAHRWCHRIASEDAFAGALVRQTGSISSFAAAWPRIVSFNSTYTERK